MIRGFYFALLVWCLGTAVCFGTIKSFPDVVAVSRDGEWKVSAISPDNRPGANCFGWQDNFVYSAFSNRGTKLAWTRKQAEQEPEEYSPSRIVVANDGWVAIQTSWDGLVFVDPTGRNRGHVNDLKKALPETDTREYGIGSSVGLIWEPKSLWYFLTTGRERLFVVRTWWGHRILIDPKSGKTIPETEEIANLATESEKEWALWLLGEYYGDFVAENNVPSILLGIHLAGSLRLGKAIPMLRDLEQSEYASLKMLRLRPDSPTEVVPFSFRYFRARQASRLALRRLGQKTTTLPIYEFATSSRDEYLRPEPPAQPIETLFSLVKPGMMAKEVVKLVGSPDFVIGDTWQFDTTGEKPATLVIEWKNDRVSQTRTTAPAWQDGLTRDMQMVMF